MADVFDLDAAVKTAAKDDKAPYQFSFDGEEYTCASPEDIDIRELKTMLVESEKDPSVQLRWMLGDDGWNMLEAAEGTFTARHLKIVTEQWLGHHGMSVPK